MVESGGLVAGASGAAAEEAAPVLTSWLPVGTLTFALKSGRSFASGGSSGRLTGASSPSSSSPS
eukprot:6353467-Prorocentrum_lima.AAC.1